MSADVVTIISGFALLAVFALVGWNLRRNRARDKQTDADGVEDDDLAG